MFEVETLFFGISLVDISVFVISSSLLFRVDCLSVFFLYWFHLARGVLGIFIWKKMPKARELIKTIKSNLETDSLVQGLNINAIKENVVKSVETSL